MFFRAAFAFLDYEKAGVLVLLENMLMLIFWALIGDQAVVFCRETVRRNIYDADEPAGRNSTHLHTLVFIMAAVIIGLVFNTVFPHEGNDFGNAGWNREESKAGQKQQAASAEIEDDFVLIEGGSFMMGSPESENWRIEDEKQHEVTVSSFYADSYETTQEQSSGISAQMVTDCLLKQNGNTRAVREQRRRSTLRSHLMPVRQISTAIIHMR